MILEIQRVSKLLDIFARAKNKPHKKYLKRSLNFFLKVMKVLTGVETLCISLRGKNLRIKTI